MPQDGSNNYQYPPGTPGIPDTTIESEAYNTFLDDLVLNDLNIPRPVHRGGTGASTADAALVNLKAEKAEQVVMAYLSQLWMPGSFRSAIGATDAPVAGHAFAGVCYINEPLVYPPTNANVTVEARDMTDGKLYVRQKTAGVWGAWLEQAGGTADLDAAYVNIAGDTMTGSLILPGDPVVALHAAPKQYVDARALDQAAYSGMQINGSMEVSQERGAVATTANAAYLVDGWRMYFAGTMVVSAGQASASTFWPGFTNVILATVTTAQPSLGAGDYFQLVQFLEGYRISRLAFGMSSAKPITIGFWSAHTLTGLYSVAVQNSPVNRSYVATYTQAVSSVPQYNVITIPGDTTGTWKNDNTTGMAISFAAASGATLTASSANAWLAGNLIAAPGQVNAVASTSNGFRITGVVVLPGSQAPTAAQSPMIMRPYDQELVTCKRYWRRLNDGNIAGEFVLTAYAATAVGTSISLNPAMRVAPTIAAVGTAFVLTNVASVNYYLSPIMVGVQANATAAGQVQMYNQAGGYLTLDARL